MLLKTTTPEWVDWVEGQLDPYHDDKSVIRSYFEEVIRLGKPIRPLVSKLKMKWFELGDIAQAQEDFAKKIDEFSLVESRLIARIRSLESRGQGTRAISIDLSLKYPNFKDQIKTQVALINDEQTLAEFYTEDLFTAQSGTPKDLQKFVNTLLRKGFWYDEIKQFIRG